MRLTFVASVLLSVALSACAFEDTKWSKDAAGGLLVEGTRNGEPFQDYYPSGAWADGPGGMPRFLQPATSPPTEATSAEPAMSQRRLRPPTLGEPDEIVTDISHYGHPVKRAFEKARWRLHRVELYQHRTYPVFYADAPYDLRLAHNDAQATRDLEQVARANGYWSFEVLAPGWEGMRAVITAEPQTHHVTSIAWQ